MYGAFVSVCQFLPDTILSESSIHTGLLVGNIAHSKPKLLGVFDAACETVKPPLTQAEEASH